MIQFDVLLAVILLLIENGQACVPMWNTAFENDRIEQAAMCPVSTTSGLSCILPFNHGGITYRTCTIRGPNNPNYRPQCAVTVDSNNTALSWSFCLVPTDAVISYITVRKNGAWTQNEGSLQGGTMLWIYGQRFAANAFASVPSVAISNTVQLTDGYAVYDCEMHHEKSTSTQLTCYTPVLPESIYQVRVYVNGHLIPLYQYIDPTRTWFMPHWSQTPTITGISPASGPPQSLFQLSGSFKTSCYSRDVDECSQESHPLISRIFIGGHLCNLIDPTDDATYAPVSETSLQCFFQGTEVGVFNVSLLISHEYGRAWVHTNLYRVSAREDLYHIQTYAIIDSITPSVGSVAGGTLLTIRGNFFHDHPKYPLEVKVGEQPCLILHSNQTTILCQTAPIPDRSLNHTAGGRGLEIYRRSGATSQTILSSANPPIPSSSIQPIWTDDALYVSRSASAETVWLIGFVRVVKTATYTFTLDTNGAAALFLSTDENPANRVLIATANLTESVPISLENQTNYYLLCVGSRANGYLRLGVRARMHQTTLTAGTSAAVFNEIQRIDVRSNITAEEQEIRYTIDTTNGTAEVQSLELDFSNFQVGFRGVYTGVLIGWPTAMALQMALNDLPTIHPLQVTVSIADTHYLIRFPVEMGDVPLLHCLSDSPNPPNVTEVIMGVAPGTSFAFALDDQLTDYIDMSSPTLTPASLFGTFNSLFSIQCPPSIQDPRSTSSIVFFQDFESNCVYDDTPITTRAFCGQCSYHGNVIVSGNTKPGHLLCFAYRILHRYVRSISLAIQINGDTSVTYWPIIPFVPAADHQWHYICLDVRERLIAQSSISASVRLLVIQQASLNYDIRNSIFLDTISIRTALPMGYEVVEGNRRFYPKHQLVYNSLRVKHTPENASMIVSFRYHNCEKPNLFVAWASHRATVYRLSEGSEGPKGTFDIVFNNQTYPSIPVNISYEDLVNRLQTSSDFGLVNVQRSGNCTGYSYTIEWLTNGGAKELIAVHGTDVTSSRVQSGGVMFQPLSGDLTRTYRNRPQVEVIVGGYTAHCVGTATCNFQWRIDQTPTISSIFQTDNTLFINGTGFSSIPASNEVTIGPGGVCIVISATATYLICEIAAAPAGNFSIHVNVIGKGRAISNRNFHASIPLRITRISPGQGGAGWFHPFLDPSLSVNPLGGGYEIQISGIGFGPSSIVRIDDRPCLNAIVNNFSMITCMVPDSNVTHTKPVWVSVTYASQTASAPTSFIYDVTDVPSILDYNPTVVTLAGGLLNITGLHFGTALATVMIGSTKAAVQKTTPTRIVAVLPPLPPGLYSISVLTENGYARPRLTMEYRFHVHTLSPQIGSLFGGTDVYIEGDGFDMSTTVTFVNGSALIACPVISYQLTRIHCRTTSAVPRLTISATGVHPIHGVGFAWSPAFATVEQGGTVEWTWGISSLLADFAYKVQQSPSGFDSGNATAQGSFLYRFQELGIYNYQSPAVDPAGRISMGGVIEVVAAQSRTFTLQVQSHSFIATSSSPHRFAFVPDLVGTVTSISPSRGPAGTLITIEGTSFSVDVSELAVLIGSSYRCPIQSLSATQIICQVDSNSSLIPGQVEEVQVRRINVGFYRPAGSMQYEFQAQITGVVPSEGSAMGGTNITIFGDGFLPDATRLIVGNIDYTSSATITHTEIHLISDKPPSIYVDQLIPIIVLVRNSPAICTSNACSFTWSSRLTPSLTSVVPTLITASTLVTLTGENLHPTQSQVTIGGEPCPILSATNTTMECQIRSLPVGNYSISAFLEGIGAASSNLILTSSAALFNVSPTVGSTNGGTLLTLEGNGFPRSVSNVQVWIGSRSCSVIRSQPDQVQCLVPAQGSMLSPAPIRLVFQGITLQSPLNFTYNNHITPTITSINPIAGIAGQLLTISGSNFIADQTAVAIGGIPCLIMNISSSRIVCVVDAGPAGNRAVTVTVSNVGVSNTNILFRYLLQLTSIAPIRGSFGGGQLITLTGHGFNSTGLTVTICQQPCLSISLLSNTQLTCRTPSIPFLFADRLCNATVLAGNLIQSISYLYQANLTAMVSNIQPSRGGTGGGTLVTLNGTKLDQAIQVSIGGVSCTIQSRTSTMLTCVTSPYAGSSTQASVVVHLGDAGVAVGFVFFQYIDLWSSPWTWGGLPPPEEGTLVSIEGGKTIYFDTVTPILKALLIDNATLIFDDHQDVALNVEYILIINGGRLQVGTASNPFQHRAVITMYGHLRSIELPIFGAKVLAIREGIVDMHGSPSVRTWTRLALTANPGAREVTLQHPVDWPMGSRIVIATTGNYLSQGQTELRTIVAVSSNGSVLTLDTPLTYQHLGITQRVGSTSVEIRAEVGLLTHNVIFRGSVDTSQTDTIPACPQGFNPGEFAVQTCFLGRYGEEMGSDEFGASIMVSASTENSNAIQRVILRLSNIEITHAGQAFRLGRYPVHFHMNGNMNQSYIRSSSIHHTFNRAVNIHATHFVTVENNVIYNVRGGAMFLEDGVEVGNVFRSNLAVFVRSSSSLLNEDVTPAAFWITHPNNIVEHNAVAGGTHFGYWYRLLRTPDGPSFAMYRNLCPYRQVFGRFFNNTVHSCGRFGVWVFPEYSPTSVGSCTGDNPIQAVFDRLIAWRNSRGFEWVMASNIQIRHALIFDHQETGIRCTSAFNHQVLNLVNLRSTFYRENRGSSIINSIIIGDSGQSVSPIEPSEGGLVVMWDRGLRVRNVTFINFPSAKTQAIFGPIIVGRCTAFCGGWLTKFSQLTFNNVLNRGRFRWAYDGIYHDEDGSLSTIPNSMILPPDGLTNRSSGCTITPNFLNAITCPASMGNWIRLAFNQASLGRNSESLFVYDTNNRFTMVLNLAKRLTHPRGYMMTLLAGQSYLFLFQNANISVNLSYSGAVYSLEPGDFLIIRHRISFLPDRVSTISGWGWIPRSFASLSASNKNGDWHYDETAQLLSYIVKNPSSSTTTIDISIALNVVKCRYLNCVPPPQPGLELPASARPSTALFWSNHSHWTFTSTGQKPSENSDVFIPRTIWMVVDQPLPRLRSLRIDGVLEFEQDLNNTLIVNHILINGGQLIVGWPNNPLRSQVDIIINGSSTVEVQLPNGSGSIGPRVIGVLGGLDLHGLPHNITWTRLASTAAIGERVIHLSEPVDWTVGDEIILTTTDTRIDHVERHTIANISADGTRITLIQPLTYTHRVIDHQFDNGQRYHIAGAVGLLTRNIRVISASPTSEKFGFRILVTDYSTNIWNPVGAEYLPTYYKGYARLSNVQLIGFGQFVNAADEDKREGIHLYNLGPWNASRPTYIDACAFDTGYYPAIGLWSTDGIPIRNNVIYNTYESALIITGKDNLVQNNLISTIYWSGTAQPDSAPFNINYDSAILAKDAITLIMRDNLVSGVDRLAYRIHGDTCPDAFVPPGFINEYDNNEAHSAMAGVSIWPKDKGIEGTNCMLIKGFKTYKTYHYGFYISTARNLIFDSVAVADSNVGIFSLVIGPHARTHRTGNNSVIIRNSIILGTATPDDCIDRRDLNSTNAKFSSKAVPAVAPLDSNGEPRERVGISFPYFTQDNLIPIHSFTSIAAYPSIDGVMRVINVTFAFFNDHCSRRDVLFRVSQHNDDGQHPVITSHLAIYNTSQNNLIFNGRPNLAKVNPSDCGEMDCDGLKKGLLIDTDGSLFGQPSAVFSQSEYRWNHQAHGVGDFRIPRAAIRNDTPYRGIIRAPSCQYQSAWQMYQCPNVTDYRMLIIESMDDDSETRRLSPVAVLSNGYLDLLNGPQDHGWCNGYTCQRRLSTFIAIVRAREHVDLYFTSTTPRHVRFRLLNSDRSILTTIGLFYNSLQHIDVYANNIFIPPTNRDPSSSSLILLDQPSAVTLNSSIGSNYFDRSTQMLTVLISGDVVIDLKMSDLIVLTFGFPASTSISFFQGNVLNHLATLLGVPRAKIRRVSIITANGNIRMRRQLPSIELRLEIREDPPMNLTADDEQTSQLTMNTNAAIINLYQSGELNERWKSDPELNQTIPLSLSVQEPSDQSTVDLKVISRIVLITSPSSCRERSPCDIQPVLVALDGNGDVIDKLGSNDQPWQIAARVLGQSNIPLINAMTNYSNGQSQYQRFGITILGSYQVEFRLIPPSNVSSTFVFNTSLIVTSSIVPVTPAILAARSWNSVDVVSVNESFNITAILIDRISAIPLSNIQWNEFQWLTRASLYRLPQHNRDGRLIVQPKSTVLVDSINGTMTFTDLAIDAVGMYIIEIHITSSNQQYSMMTNTSGILVKEASAELVPIDSPTSYVMLRTQASREIVRASLYNYFLTIEMPLISDLLFSSDMDLVMAVFVPKSDSSVALRSAVSTLINSGADAIEDAEISSITIFSRSYSVVSRPSVKLPWFPSSTSTNSTGLIVGLVVGLVSAALLLALTMFGYQKYHIHRRGRRLYNEPGVLVPPPPSAPTESSSISPAGPMEERISSATTTRTKDDRLHSSSSAMPSIDIIKLH